MSERKPPWIVGEPGVRDAPPVAWAAARLESAAAERGLDVAETLSLAFAEELHPEGFRVRRAEGGRIDVVAGGPVGASYALSDLADRITLAADPSAVLASVDDEDASPAVPVRGILRSFSSDTLDRPWLLDRAFWTSYLDELAAQRVNWFQLAFGMQYNYSHEEDVVDNYLCFAYPFLLEVPGHDVTVENLEPGEREENLAALRFISDEAARRGIHFQLGLWNHAAQPEIVESPNLRYRIAGLADQDIATYSAQALAMLLAECPNISGVTFRVHYEGGVPEAGRVDFWRTVMTAIRDAGRPLIVDMHAKGVDADLIAVAGETGGSAVLSAKYWAEHQGLPYHQASVRELERGVPQDDGLRGITQGARRFTRYGYGDFLPSDRDHDLLFRFWPGTHRLLLWGDPELFAGYGRESVIAGSIGVELCEPLTFRGRKATAGDGSRDLYVDPELGLGLADWRKYAYEYRLWGRLLYDPDASPETWRRWLEAAFPGAAAQMETALGAASRILPLMTVAMGFAPDNQVYWPEVFTDVPLAGDAASRTYGGELPDPRTWGAVSPMDPVTFESTDAYVDGLISGTPSGRHTPIDVAGWLDRLTADAEAALTEAEATAPASAELRRWSVDVRIMVQLGRFFAAKIRAGVDYGLARRLDDAALMTSAARHAAEAAAAWAGILPVVDGVYADSLGFGTTIPMGDRRTTHGGHWSDRLPAIRKDAEDLAAEAARLSRADAGAGAAVPEVSPAPEAPAVVFEVADVLEPGVDLPVTVRCLEPGAQVVLQYRHLNQSEFFVEAPMARAEPGVFTTTVPAAYTASPDSLILFAIVRSQDGRHAWMLPGLHRSLADRPYLVVDHPDQPALRPLAAMRP